jgi:hypothetical protein
VGCCEKFLSEQVSVMLRLLLFKGGEVFEAVFLLEGFLGVLDRTGLTGLLNRSDWFPLPGERLSHTEVV